MADSLPTLTVKNNLILELNLVQPHVFLQNPQARAALKPWRSPPALKCTSNSDMDTTGRAAVLVTTVLSSHKPIYKTAPGGGYGDTCDAHSKPLSPCQRQPRLVSASVKRSSECLLGHQELRGRDSRLALLSPRPHVLRRSSTGIPSPWWMTEAGPQHCRKEQN